LNRRPKGHLAVVLGRSQPNTAGRGGEKNFRWSQRFIIFFKVWSEKEAQKRGRSKNI